MRVVSLLAWPSMLPIAGLGGVLGLSLVGEVLLIAFDVVPPPDGFLLGIATSAVFVFALVHGSYWIETSELSPDRYGRISYWCLGGALAFLLTNLGFMRTIPPETTMQAVSWIRWAISLGGGMGFLIGLFEARAITREIAAERARIRQRTLERERDRLEEFASVVSHDLRNPLTVANGRLELARRQHGDDEHLDAIGAALDRMKMIVEETLTLARQGKTVDETTAVDLTGVARTSWSSVSTATRELTLEETGTIRADRGRLQHVFENLFRNAIEHGDPEVTIRVGMLDRMDGFYVEDDGPGIPEAERDRVLEMGYSSSDSGGGFGLAIVKQIVEAHGWELRITDGTDGGARFEISDVTVVG